MDWSPKQGQALDAVAHWHDSSQEPVFRLFGFAGTGKTTLARHFGTALRKVLYATFTGKAAHVLRQKGCPNASTIHQLIYQPTGSSEDRAREIKAALDELIMEIHAECTPEERDGAVDASKEVQRLRAELDTEGKRPRSMSFDLKVHSDLTGADLLIVDEVSMVDERIGKDLLSFGTKILALGDPAQLPPVRGSGFFTAREPDMLLTEIHRQARDNPIVDMATRVRMGEQLQMGDYGESRVIKWTEVSEDVAFGANQILCGRNKTRHALNRRVRTLMGQQGAFPVEGDKLVCLRNDHDRGLLNGSLWRVVASNGEYADRVVMDIEPMEDIGSRQQVAAHAAYFRGEEPRGYEQMDAPSFDYGYALTCHKAQGSQWDDVLVMDESGAFPADQSRWLYTAITRAAKRVTIARK